MSSPNLCTVVSRISKYCENDHLSPIGTCYEDSCCTAMETAISWHYRLAQFSHVLFSCLGISLVVLYLWKFASKHMLPQNVRTLTNIMLSLIVIHSIDMILFHIYHLIQSLRVSSANPCFVMETVEFCGPFRYVFSFCILAMAIVQYCIYIDRLLCAFYKHYMDKKRTILIVQLIQLVVITVLVVKWSYRNEEPESYLLSCVNSPKSSAEDVLIAVAAVLPINFICFFLSIWLFRVFKKKEKGSSLSPNRRFNITRRFSAAVDVESSEFLYHTTGTQALLMILFSSVSVVVHFTFHVVSRPVWNTFNTISYIYSFYSTIVPLVMILYAQNTSENRKTKISNQVKLKSIGVEGADHYFGMMKSQWE